MSEKPHLLQDLCGVVCLWRDGLQHIPSLEHPSQAIQQFLCLVVLVCHLQRCHCAIKILQLQQWKIEHIFPVTATNHWLILS